jgi:hypothetical protein
MSQGAAHGTNAGIYRSLAAKRRFVMPAPSPHPGWDLGAMLRNNRAIAPSFHPRSAERRPSAGDIQQCKHLP